MTRNVARLFLAFAIAILLVLTPELATASKWASYRSLDGGSIRQVDDGWVFTVDAKGKIPRLPDEYLTEGRGCFGYVWVSKVLPYSLWGDIEVLAILYEDSYYNNDGYNKPGPYGIHGPWKWHIFYGLDSFYIRMYDLYAIMSEDLDQNNSQLAVFKVAADTMHFKLPSSLSLDMQKYYSVASFRVGSREYGSAPYGTTGIILQSVVDCEKVFG